MFYSFAETEFPSFMMSFPQYSRIVPTHRMVRVGDVDVMMGGSSGDSSVFEYVSEKNYIKFYVRPDCMYFKLMSVGDVVVEHNFTEFTEIKDYISRYS